MNLEPRKKPIADGEWVVTIQLEVRGQAVGAPVERRFNDAYVAKNPRDAGYLVARTVEEMAKGRK